MSVQKLAEDWKKQVGTVYTKEEIERVWLSSGFNMQVTRETIKHFVDSIGDLNTLYRYPDYAKKTKYNHLIAAPCFLYSSILAPSPTKTGLPTQITTWDAWDAGVAWEGLRPLCEGDDINYKGHLSNGCSIEAE